MSKDGSSFPSGLRILLVDSDVGCLENLRTKLQQGCNYEVTPCTRASDALSLLLEKKDGFDIVLTNCSMPDMDGIQLLESIRSMETATYDLPVVVFSGEQDRDAATRAIAKGACDFLLKPISEETQKMLWQHVVRLKLGKEGAIDHNSISKVNHPQRHGSSCNDAIAASQSKGSSKRKRDVCCDEENINKNNAGTAAATKAKKSRVQWTKGLQQKFLDAIDIIERRKNPERRFRINGRAADDEHAVPREIVEEMRKMGVTGLTRAQVSSHLQKHRNDKNKEAESTARGNTQSDQSFLTTGQCYYQDLLPESCEVRYGAQEFDNYFISRIAQQVGPLPVSRMTNQYADQPIQSSVWSSLPMMVPAPRDSGNQQKPPDPPDAINRTAPKISQSPGNSKDRVPEPVPETAGFDATAATTGNTSRFDTGNLVAPTDLYEDIGPLGLQGRLDTPWLDIFFDSSGSIIF